MPTVGTTTVQSVLTTSASGVTTYWERNTAFTSPLTLPVAENNYLFDLGFNFEYKLDWIKAYIIFVKNFGGFTYGPGWADQDIDSTGYLIDAGVNIYYGPFSFTVNGFLASGDNFSDEVDVRSDGNFRYPRGASHYWSEILGMGALDSLLGGSNLNSTYYALAHPDYPLVLAPEADSEFLPPTHLIYWLDRFDLLPYRDLPRTA